MKYYLTTFLLLLSLGLFSMQNTVAGEPVVVIVNEANQQSLTQQDIKNIYSDIVFQWQNGERITVYNLPVDAEERETFRLPTRSRTRLKPSARVWSRNW